MQGGGKNGAGDAAVLPPSKQVTPPPYSAQPTRLTAEELERRQRVPAQISPFLPIALHSLHALPYTPNLHETYSTTDPFKSTTLVPFSLLLPLYPCSGFEI